MPRQIVLILALIGMFWTSSIANWEGDASERVNPARAELTFHGAWFEISYPGSFVANPSMESSTADGYDSAEFLSPDGSVSFYVYAPQWGGEAGDIALDPRREVLVSEKCSEKDDRRIRWFTICARDESYCRSYQDTTAQQGSIRTILGIKYRSEEARRRHIEEYGRFRNSLRQYGD